MKCKDEIVINFAREARLALDRRDQDVGDLIERFDDAETFREVERQGLEGAIHGSYPRCLGRSRGLEPAFQRDPEHGSDAIA